MLKKAIYKIALTIIPTHIRHPLARYFGLVTSYIYKIPGVGKYLFVKKLETHEATPLQVSIEVTSICNAKCIMCPRHLMRRKMELMPFDLYSKVVIEARDLGVKKFALNGYGELFTAKRDYRKYIDFLFDQIPDAKVHINSNASLLDEKAAKYVIERGIDAIHIDIDGATKDTFEKVREGLSYDDVFNNTLNLINMRNSMGRKLPKVRVGIIKQPENEHEIEKHYNQWKGKADIAATDFIVSRLGFFNTGNTRGSNPCWLLWSELNIWSNGEAVLCCDDWDAKEVIGDSKTQTLKEIWNSDKLRSFRKLHQQKMASKIAACAKCDFSRTGPAWFQSNQHAG